MRISWGTLAACFAVIVLVGKCSPKDDTDPPDGRSGMGLRIDHRTGCQYLTTPGLLGEAAITPRLDSAGRHICHRQEVPDGGR